MTSQDSDIKLFEKAERALTYFTGKGIQIERIIEEESRKIRGRLGLMNFDNLTDKGLNEEIVKALVRKNPDTIPLEVMAHAKDLSPVFLTYCLYEEETYKNFRYFLDKNK